MLQFGNKTFYFKNNVTTFVTKYFSIQKLLPMKKETLRSNLGLTQEELAMLLGTNRINIAMFETGRRELPNDSITKVLPALTHHQGLKEHSEPVIKLLESEKKKTTEWLTRELRTTDYKLRKCEDKIAAMESKRSEAIAALETVCFLETQSNELAFPGTKSFIRSRAVTLLNKNPLHQLEELKLKKEQLDFLKKSLEEKLK